MAAKTAQHLFRRLTFQLVLGLVVIGFLAGGGVSAGTGSDKNTSPSDSGDEELAYPVLGSILSSVASEAEEEDDPEYSALTEEPFAVPAIDGDSVIVSVYLDGTAADGESTAAAQFLKREGVRYFHAQADYLEADVPLDLLGELSSQPGIWRIRIADQATPNFGPVLSEGAGSHSALSWHARGITGHGVTIGVIDLGFHGIQALMGTELPSTIQARCYRIAGDYSEDLQDCEDMSGPEAHGTGVAESVMDVAPNATLLIARPWTNGDLLESVGWMLREGARVINYSAGNPWDGPGDGTSMLPLSPLTTVDFAVNYGAVWTNSAGNQADGNIWYGPFVDQDNDNYHDWAPGDRFQRFRITEETTIRVELRWEDSWQHAASDLNLIVTEEATGNRIKLSTDPQDGRRGQVPHEYARYTITRPGWYNLSVRLKATDEAPDWIQLHAWEGITLEHYTEHHSIVNPAESANPGLLAVGAAPWQSPTTIDAYSSQGPTPDGRIKPDIVGSDFGSNVTYGNVFAGTSQAAPHVAGLAALVIQQNPSFTPAETTAYLKSHALDFGAAGPDNVWGHGYAQLPTPADCFGTLSFEQTVNDDWDESCRSSVSPFGPARFYSFDWPGKGELSVLASTYDLADRPYLAIRAGDNERHSTPLLSESESFAVPGTGATRSRGIDVLGSLPAGRYTLEVAMLESADAGPHNFRFIANPIPYVQVLAPSNVTEGDELKIALMTYPGTSKSRTVNVSVTGPPLANGASYPTQVTLSKRGLGWITLQTQDDQANSPNQAITVTVRPALYYYYLPHETLGQATVEILDRSVSQPQPAPNCVSDTLLSQVRGYYDNNKLRAPGFGTNWKRVLIAFGDETDTDLTPFTAAEARQREPLWDGWSPVREALDCLEGNVSTTEENDVGQ